jgi:hypothetical protein
LQNANHPKVFGSFCLQKEHPFPHFSKKKDIPVLHQKDENIRGTTFIPMRDTQISEISQISHPSLTGT